MPVRPLRKKVAGELVGEVGFHSEVLYVPDSAKKKIRLAMKVLAIGPECAEVGPGTVVILPEAGWVVVKVKEEDGEVKEYVLVEERLLMGALD